MTVTLPKEVMSNGVTSIFEILTVEVKFTDQYEIGGFLIQTQHGLKILVKLKTHLILRLQDKPYQGIFQRVHPCVNPMIPAMNGHQLVK